MFTLASALGTLLLDQATKAVVLSVMSVGESIPVVAGVFHITYIVNTGGVFGMFPGGSGVITAISILVILAMVVFARRPLRGKYLPVALGFALGGALGNLVDRLRLGGVVDFLDLRVWPIFNVADMGLVMAAGLIALEVFRLEGRDNR